MVLAGLSCTEPHLRELDAQVVEDARAKPTPRDAVANGQSTERADSGTGPNCTDDPSTLGNDCAKVVYCLNVGACPIGPSRCCMGLSGVDNTCTTDSTCGNLQPSECDGPEDCAAGEVCCLGNVQGLCTQKANCSEPNRICHQTSDCDAARCLPGTDDFPVRLFVKWGFCRG